jgi:hypothetical protein
MYFLFFRLLSLYDTESSCAASIWFSIWLQRERKIFFSWVLSSLDCKLSCWKTTLSFLKTLFTTWLSFLRIDVQHFFGVRFFLLFLRFVCFGFVKEKQNLIFLFRGERKNMGAHLFPLIEIKLSSRMVSLSQLTFQNWWREDN